MIARGENWSSSAAAAGVGAGAGAATATRGAREIGEVRGIGEGVLRGVDARKGHAVHAIGAEGVTGERGDEGRVDPSR